MRSLVYIAGLGHSGSTLLDLIVGGHPRLVGLGEVKQVLQGDRLQRDRLQTEVCTCGRTMPECEFWGRALEKVRSIGREDYVERYQALLEVFDGVFDPGIIPVDSSKSMPYLRMLVGVPELDLKVLYIIRDVRSWTVSQLDTIERAKKKPKLFQGNAYYFFWRWYVRNRRYLRFTAEQHLDVYPVGYEELALQPGKTMRAVCRLLGVEFDSSMLNLRNTGSHSVLGSRMRTQKDKMKIRYDHRWFLRSEWKIPSLLFPNIMKYNTKHVYGNELERMWKE
jgi:hypothetical protein